MKIGMTISNYRCFTDETPARFTLRDGYVAFVGPNNAGKSTLLKFFYELRDFWKNLSDRGNRWVPDVLKGESSAFGVHDVHDRREIFSDVNDRGLEVSIDFSYSPQTQTPIGILPLQRAVLQIRRDYQVPSLNVYASDGLVHTAGDASLRWDGKTLNAEGGKKQVDLRPLVSLFQDFYDVYYVGPFRNALHTGGGMHHDVQIGSDFVATWHELQVGTDKVAIRRILRLTEEIGSLLGIKDLQIEAAPKLNTLQLRYGGRVFKLSEVGSGMSQLIVTLGNVGLGAASWILIDEPESNLHPLMQRRFLMSLAAYSRRGIIFATHSLGLARSTADDIYVVRPGQQGSGVAPLAATPTLAEFLGELSYGSYRELGGDCILLVEGVHDVRTVQELLRQRGKDQEVVLLPLGGSTLIAGDREPELSEVLRISDQVFALVDSERITPGEPLTGNRQAFKETCENLGIDLHILELRAIENYFTERAIQEVFGKNYQALGNFGSLREATPCWGKHDNWRIAREMTIDELAGTDLGTFLDRLGRRR